MPKATTKRPFTFRRAHPDAVPNLLAGANERIEQNNAEAWRNFPIDPATEVFVEQGRPGRAPSITFENDVIEVRVELVADFDPYRCRWTLLTPAILQTIKPEEIVRVQWRYRRNERKAPMQQAPDPEFVPLPENEIEPTRQFIADLIAAHPQSPEPVMRLNGVTMEVQDRGLVRIELGDDPKLTVLLFVAFGWTPWRKDGRWTAPRKGAVMSGSYIPTHVFRRDKAAAA